MDEKRYLKLSFLLLIFQNIYFYIGSFLGAINSFFVLLIFYIDLVFYLFLVMVLLNYGIKNKTKLPIISSIIFCIWLIISIIWRLFLNLFSSLSIYIDLNNDLNIINDVYNIFLIAGIVFYIGLFTLSKIVTVDRIGILLINFYGISNILGIFLTIVIWGIFIKLLIIPAIGTMTYLYLYKHIDQKLFS